MLIRQQLATDRGGLCRIPQFISHFVSGPSLGAHQVDLADGASTSSHMTAPRGAKAASGAQDIGCSALPSAPRSFAKAAILRCRPSRHAEVSSVAASFGPTYVSLIDISPMVSRGGSACVTHV